jgi:hypothetical protein
MTNDDLEAHAAMVIDMHIIQEMKCCTCWWQIIWWIWRTYDNHFVLLLGMTACGDDHQHTQHFRNNLNNRWTQFPAICDDGLEAHAMTIIDMWVKSLSTLLIFEEEGFRQDRTYWFNSLPVQSWCVQECTAGCTTTASLLSPSVSSMLFHHSPDTVFLIIGH